MKHLFTAAAMLFSMTAFAQVGINNTSPKATLDITAKTTDGSKPEGLIIPQLSGSNIHTATAAGVYGSNQKGLIIYATSADSSPTGATANITAAGYYYFDGTNWQKVMTGSVANSDLTTGVGGIYKGSGSLSGNTTVTQGANTLAFTSTATNGFSVDGTTLSVDAANNRVGIGTTTPTSRLVLENDNNTDDYDDFMIDTYSTTATPSILLTQSRGTKATPANLQNGDIMGGFNFRGRANGTSSTMSTINSIYRGNGTTILSDLNFSTSGTTKMRIDENGNVGIGTSSPNSSALLDLNSSNKGILFPKVNLSGVNDATTITSPSTGLVIYNTNTSLVNGVGLYINSGTSSAPIWDKLIVCTIGAGASSVGQIMRYPCVTMTVNAGSIKPVSYHTSFTQPNGANGVINTISGGSLAADNSTLNLPAGTYRVDLILSGAWASPPAINAGSVQVFVNGTLYSDHLFTAGTTVGDVVTLTTTSTVQLKISAYALNFTLDASTSGSSTNSIIAITRLL